MNALISEAYLEQQKAMHTMDNYGVSGHKYAAQVQNLAEMLKTSDILDYGCGKRTLERALGFLIRNYDPAIEEFSQLPDHPADIVVCSDVLEHIEPECVDAVLDDIKRLTRRACLLVVATGPAKKVLPDGRNAHIIQEGSNWWLPKIIDRFELLVFQSLSREFLVIARPK